MSTLYNRAELVITWLGVEEPPGSLEALDRDPHLTLKLTCLQNLEIKLEDSHDLISLKGMFTRQEKEYLALGKVMRNLLKRPYWDRVWISQEVFHACEVNVWFGAAGEQPLMVLGKWYTAYRGGERELSPVPRSDCGFGAVYALKSQASIHLLQLLWRFRLAQCADPPDKLYAFVGLGNKTGLEGLDVDYGKSMEQLCADVERLIPSRSSSVRFCLLGPNSVDVEQ